MFLYPQMGFMAIIPATILVTISFFVLFALNSKIVKRNIEIFGYFVVAMLWICAVAVLSAGIFVATNAPSMNCMGGKMMHMKMMKDKPCDMKGMMTPEAGVANAKKSMAKKMKAKKVEPPVIVPAPAEKK